MASVGAGAISLGPRYSIALACWLTKGQILRESIQRISTPTRPERCIVTIASLDQWLATIEKHRYQWLAD